MKRIRRVHSEERGIALIVVMAMIVVLGVIATAVLANALQVKNATASERASKQAYAAAVNGLRSAMFWLNAAIPADNGCPPLPGQTAAQAPNGTSGLCGPYESDNISGAASVSTQPTVNQRFTYWITPVLSPSADTCTGNAPITARLGVTIRDRCITALGESLRGNKITSTKRVQARVSATNALFPVPGIFGASCLSIGVSVNAGDTDCRPTGNGASNSDYYGTIGSNGPVNAGLKNWNYDPSTTDAFQKLAPATLYLGYTSPTSSTLPAYAIKVQNVPSPFVTPATGCNVGQTFCNGSLPPLPYNSSAAGPYQNPVHVFGRWFQPFRMGTLFGQPPPMVLAGNSLPTGCTTTDVSVCNNNALITAAAGTPSGCATLSASRVLSIATDCVLRIPNGTYDFCGIQFGSKGGAVLPLDTSSTAEIRVFLDNKNRTVGTSAACANSTSGKIDWGGNGSSVSRWMTTNVASNVTAADCLNAFNGDTWTALAGQIYAYGGGDPTQDPVNNYPVTVSAPSLDIPAIIFNGSIIATNSTLNLTASNTCVNGGIAAGAVNIANNAGFKWDPHVDQAHLSLNSNTFYRTASSTCGTAGFRFNDTTSAPTYPTYPSDGC